MSEPATLPETVTRTVEAALNRYINLDPELPQKFAPLDGKIVAIELLGIDVVFYLQPVDGRLRVLSVCDRPPDTTLRGTPLTMARLGLSRTSTELLFSGEVAIEGDAELGQQFKKLIDSIDVDWEEQLSRIVGDVIAHQTAVAWQGFQHWVRQAVDTLRRDAAEYLQYESRDLPTRDEVDAYMDGVDQLRIDVDRLAQRVERLKQRRLESGGDA